MDTNSLAQWVSGKGFSKCADPTGNKMKQMLLGGAVTRGS